MSKSRQLQGISGRGKDPVVRQVTSQRSSQSVGQHLSLLTTQVLAQCASDANNTIQQRTKKPHREKSETPANNFTSAINNLVSKRINLIHGLKTSDFFPRSDWRMDRVPDLTIGQILQVRLALIGWTGTGS